MTLFHATSVELHVALQVKSADHKLAQQNIPQPTSWLIAQQGTFSIAPIFDYKDSPSEPPPTNGDPIPATEWSHGGDRTACKPASTDD